MTHTHHMSSTGAAEVVSRAMTSAAATTTSRSINDGSPAAADLTGFWLLLSGKDVTPTHPPPNGKRARVVMMHGWLMSHNCWLTTATQLRDRYGHDVLLFDFHGHGRSGFLPHYKDNTPGAFVAQLRRVLQHVGWAPSNDGGGGGTSGGGIGDINNSSSDDSNSNGGGDDGLVLCGLSLGGVVSLRYCDTYPSEVARIILVSSPGLDERWWIPSTLTYPLRQAVLLAADAADAGWVGGDAGRWMVRRLAPLKTFLSHINLVRDTPTFGVPPDMPLRLKKSGKPLVLVWGLLDQFHTPQLRRWKADRPRAEDVAAAAAAAAEGGVESGAYGGRSSSSSSASAAGGGGGGGGDDKGVHIHVERYWDHFAACMLLDRLELASKPHFGHDAPLPPPQTRPNRLPRARL